MKSAQSRSASLPVETICDRPISCCAARLEMKLPLAPLCVTTAMPPGLLGARKPPVHSGTLLVKLTKPRQFGPSNDTLCCRANAPRRAWCSAPWWPVSAKPDVRITAFRTSAAARSAMASSIAAIGTISRPRSIGAPTATHEVAAARPCTVPPRRLTRWTSPGYFRLIRLSKVFCDHRERSVAPTSAIDLGRSMAFRSRFMDWRRGRSGRAVAASLRRRSGRSVHRVVHTARAGRA